MMRGSCVALTQQALANSVHFLEGRWISLHLSNLKRATRDETPCQVEDIDSLVMARTILDCYF